MASSVVLDFDRNPNISDIERLQSFKESVERAFNELEVTMDDLPLETHPMMQSMSKGDFRILFDDYGHFKVVTANAVEAKKGDFKDLYADYAKIDQANIDQAWVEDLMVTGDFIAKNVNAGDGSYSRRLVGVEIYGDLIKAGTLKADTLILQGTDGIYRRLNIDSLGQTTVDSDPKYNEKLDGSVLVKESVTAEHINVYDLFAQNITSTGDFNMGGKGALVYNAEKDELSIRAKELYLGSEGRALNGDYMISQINLASDTAKIQAKHINLQGAVSISDFDTDLSGKFSDIEDATGDLSDTISAWCSKNDATYIDGGKIYTNSIKADQIDVNSIFAKDINATGSITGAKLYGAHVETDSGEIAGWELSDDKLRALREGIVLPNSSGYPQQYALVSELYSKPDYYDRTVDMEGIYPSGHSIFAVPLLHFSLNENETGKSVETALELISTMGEIKTLLENSQGGALELSNGVSLLASKGGHIGFTTQSSTGEGAYAQCYIQDNSVSFDVRDEKEDISAGFALFHGEGKSHCNLFADEIILGGNLNFENRDQTLLALLGYTPSYMQVRTTEDGPTWSTAYQNFWPYHGDAVPTVWSNYKGNLTLDTCVVTFGDRTGVTTYGIRIGKDIHAVRVHSNVYLFSETDSPTGVLATIYRWRESADTKLTAFSQAATHIEHNNGSYGTCASNAIIGVQEGDFIFIGAWKSTASRVINTPAGSGRTNMIVEAIG